jgi:hypothetical protein
LWIARHRPGGKMNEYEDLDLPRDSESGAALEAGTLHSSPPRTEKTILVLLTTLLSEDRRSLLL